MNKYWLSLIAGIVVLIGAFFLGWFSKPSEEPRIETKIVREIDTVEVEKIIEKKVFRTVSKIDTVYQDKRITEYADSLKGTEDKVEYNIKHTIQDSDSVYSTWDLKIKNLVTTVSDKITIDSTKTVVEYKYIPKPIILNEWFWISALEFAAIILIAFVSVI